MTTIKVKVNVTSGATFTSSSFESTIEELIDGGHTITNQEIDRLLNGESVTLTSYNLVGTPTKRTLKHLS